MPKPIPTPQHRPDRTATAILRRLEEYATTTPETTHQEHEDRVVGLQHIWLTAKRAWEREMAAAQAGGVSLNRQQELTGLVRSSVQTHVRKGRDQSREAAA